MQAEPTKPFKTLVPEELLKSSIVNLRRAFGDEVTKIHCKVCDEIKTTPQLEEESGFDQVVPIVYTVMYAKGRIYKRKEEWLSKDEWKKKREREETMLKVLDGISPEDLQVLLSSKQSKTE
jgi:hypothetical protein